MKTSEFQKLIGLPVTGVADPITEAAWRNYCLKNNLTGQLISEAAYTEEEDASTGFLTTDYRDKLNIRINNYFLKKGQYLSGCKQKEYVFLHFTAGWDNPYRVVDDWNTDTRGEIGTQYVIGGRHPQTLADKHDGEILQTMTYSDYAWHLGIGNTQMHRESVGIEVCNFGALKRSGNDFVSWANRRIAQSEIVDLKADFRGERYFHKLTDKQLDSIYFLLHKIQVDTKIDITKGLKDRLKKMDKFKAFDYDPEIRAGKIKGLFVHANVSPKNKYGNYEKWDLFPQDELIDLINSL